MSGGNSSSSGTVKAAADQLRAAVARVEDAMDQENISPTGPMGVVLAAVGAAMVRVAEVCERCEAGAFAAVSDARAAVEADLQRLKTGVAAAAIALNQARTAQSVLEVQRETLVSRMVGDIAPRIAAGLKDLLVIRERRLNRNLQTRRYVVVGAVTLALVGGGYALRAVQDHNATEAFSRCYAAQVVDQATGKAYCALDAIIR